MNETSVTWACCCGRTRLRVDPRGGTRVICYCRDCQAFARHFSHTDMLDSRGGSDLYQVAPSQVAFETGEETLGAIRLTGQGPIRWHAGCCGTPMANTWTSPALPFVTLTAARIATSDRLGPIRAQVFRRHALGYVEREGGGVLSLYLGFARRVIWAYLTGRGRVSPFFDDQGLPRADVHRLTDAERDAAYDAEQTV